MIWVTALDRGHWLQFIHLRERMHNIWIQPIYLLIKDSGGSVETDTHHQPNENQVRMKAHPPFHAARRTHKGLPKLQRIVF